MFKALVQLQVLFVKLKFLFHSIKWIRTYYTDSQ